MACPSSRKLATGQKAGLYFSGQRHFFHKICQALDGSSNAIISPLLAGSSLNIREYFSNGNPSVVTTKFECIKIPHCVRNTGRLNEPSPA